MLRDIKLSKAEISKIIQSDGSWLDNSGKKTLKMLLLISLEITYLA